MEFFKLKLVLVVGDMALNTYLVIWESSLFLDFSEHPLSFQMSQYSQNVGAPPLYCVMVTNYLD